MYPMDLDYGQDNAELTKKLEVENSKSKLDKAIKQLVTLIFDIESMKKAMVEFEVRQSITLQAAADSRVSTISFI